MAKSDTALASFNKGITCPASVFSAFAGDIGLDEKIAKDRLWVRCWDLKDRECLRCGLRRDHGDRPYIWDG